MLLAQFARFALQFAALAILSRLLSPAEFGIAAMVTAVVAIGEVLRDFGLSAATLQARELSREQRSFLFAVNTVIGVLLAIVVFATAGLMADFYNSPEAEQVAQWMSAYFVFSGAGAQYRASLLREHKFGSVAIAEVASYFLAVSGAVVVATFGFGVMSLVVQQIAYAALSMTLFVSFGRWLPTLPWRGARQSLGLLAIGRDVFLTQVISHFTRNVDSVIAGRAFGATGLGFYNRGFQLVMLPISQINGPATSVAVPILSKVRDRRSVYNDSLVRAQDALLLAMVAVIGAVVIWAELVVRVLLGPGWDAAVPIVRVLAIAALFQGASYVAYWVFLSKGLTRSHLRFTICTRPVVIVLLIAGSHWGPIGLATGYSLGASLIWPAALVWLSVVSDVSTWRVFKSAAVIVVPGAIGATCGLWVAVQSDALIAGPLLGTATMVVVGGMTFAASGSFRSAVSNAVEFGADAAHLRRSR